MKSYFTLSDISIEIGADVSQIRYWDKVLGGMGYQKVKGGVRRYTPQEADVFRKIHYFVNVEHYTLDGALRMLHEPSDVNMQTIETLSKLRRILVAMNQSLS